ncbi:MAG: VOC family protein [Anaerolineales bacterium]|nr:VOC family protein [Anaerolineales bacterium]MCW5855532.1 VOC family protein [Anaerolineales bacterium]
MADERTYPMLPCVDIDVSIAFYEHLGFKRTYRQLRPNPSAVVALEDIHIHLFGMDGFDPANSYGSVIVTVPDADALYQAFAAGLRQHYGKLPVQGIPRLLRPRKKYGTVSGFSLVDPGGNWLRVYQQGAEEETEAGEEASGLAQIILVAARLGDARGDELQALKTLETGLGRYQDAAAPDLARAYLYRAELAVRTDNAELARSSLAAAELLPLSKAERAALAEEFAHANELVHQ